MRVKYIGESFGAFGLTDGEIYECSEVDKETGGLRIVNDPNDWNFRDDPDWLPGYLYSPTNPRPLCGEHAGGRWEIIEDDEQESLRKAIYWGRIS